ncbi:hypothetical protein GQ43DRAFT_460967 [Delitschia confertaspora ATCC 74209]|uniref:Metallo-beta-lactamase domain-containing protein n=1 Tax=Delitschia confertaspora ATCC 74209 TaxID=1513339 RepID=A0A9P4MVK0_9PLEO|nr:hypothetical protein GQ43DRAFT_460967 [Delitschia confertaspora ATCC 74209]
MKYKPLYPLLTATVYLTLSASAWSYPFESFLKPLYRPSDQSPLTNLPNLAMPSSSADNADSTVSAGVMLSDVMGRVQNIAIFSGLTRDIDTVDARLDDATKNVTVLAPDNGVMKSLKRKPWEDPNDYNTFGKNAYDGGEGEDRAHRNLRRFVEAHIVPQSPWKEHSKIKTLAGKEIWYEVKDGKKTIQPGDVEVVSVAEKLLFLGTTSNTITMNFDADNLLICITCGTQFDIQYEEAPETCRICDDPRQYVPAGGQQWTRFADLRGKYKNNFTQDKVDERIWSITTDPKCGIGERAILLQTPSGNVLWDLITYLDEETVEFINSKGGLSAIVISHPHFYTTHIEWARTFSCPVYLSAEDSQWLNRADPYNHRKLISVPTETIVEGVTAIKTGGHFEGSLVLHWDKKLFIADSLYTVPSAYYHKDRQPGTTSYSFMWSIPNMIPLPPNKIHDIWKALKPFKFEATYGGFPGQDVHREDLKEQVLESMKIQVRGEGHRESGILEESW